MAHKYKQAIITRTKNRPLLFERAVKSVIAQTSDDYVHVILNDGGDKKEVERILSKHPAKNRVVIHNKQSAGLTPALNQAIKAVDSEYIAILDDDDTWAPDRVEQTNSYLDKQAGEPGVVVIMDQVIEKIEDDTIVEETRNRWHPGVTEVSLYEQCLDNYLSNGAFVYRRSLYEQLGGYDETLEVAEDWDFGIRALMQHDVTFLVTERALTNYHHRPDQKGDAGNSVFAGIDQHKRNLNLLRNKYLREDIKAGRLGIGYIMNNLAHERQQNLEREKAMDERVVRLEGHVNFVAEDINKTITDNVSVSTRAMNSFRRMTGRDS